MNRVTKSASWTDWFDFDKAAESPSAPTAAPTESSNGRTDLPPPRIRRQSRTEERPRSPNALP